MFAFDHGKSSPPIFVGHSGQEPHPGREILCAARLDGLSRQQIAKRFGVSVSTVEKELRRAQEHCVARFGRSRKIT